MMNKLAFLEGYMSKVADKKVLSPAEKETYKGADNGRVESVGTTSTAGQPANTAANAV